MELLQRWAAATFTESYNENARFGICNTQDNFERLMAALDQHMIMSLADRHGVIVYVNDKFAEVSGYAKEELIGQKHRIINSGWHDQAFFRAMWQTIRSGKIWHGRVCNRRKDGSLFWVDKTILPLRGRNANRPIEYFSVRTLIDWPEQEPLPSGI